jgi:hypothetical protein
MLLGCGQLLVLGKSNSTYAIGIAHIQRCGRAGAYEVHRNAQAGRRALPQPPHGCFTLSVSAVTRGRDSISECRSVAVYRRACSHMHMLTVTTTTLLAHIAATTAQLTCGPTMRRSLHLSNLSHRAALACSCHACSCNALPAATPPSRMSSARLQRGAAGACCVAPQQAPTHKPAHAIRGTSIIEGQVAHAKVPVRPLHVQRWHVVQGVGCVLATTQHMPPVFLQTRAARPSPGQCHAACTNGSLGHSCDLCPWAHLLSAKAAGGFQRWRRAAAVRHACGQGGPLEPASPVPCDGIRFGSAKAAHKCGMSGAAWSQHVVAKPVRRKRGL